MKGQTNEQTQTLERHQPESTKRNHQTMAPHRRLARTSEPTVVLMGGLGMVEYRRFEASDRRKAFDMFRGSVYDFVRRIGLVGLDDEDDVEAAWKRQGSTAVHLEKTAREDWVAEMDGRIVGWARSVERDGHLQLTHFFVDPSTQGQGVGRGLLDRAFAVEAEHRSIMATQNPLALGLYFRYGVEFQAQTFELGGTPEERKPIEGVHLEGSDLTDEIVTLDAETLGFSRRVDLEFLASDRPLFAVTRNGEFAGYAFGSNGTSMGPAAVVEPRLLPGVLAGLDTEAARAGIGHVRYTLPGPASAAIRWALRAGHRIDPFYEVLLADEPHIQFDRYLMTQPGFIW